jgi:uncharacterized repeat protein (TIGR03847 family)
MARMPTIVHGFDWPDRIVVGTIGRPGQREFYLQVRDGARVVSVGLEKQQSAVLAEKIDEILDELATRAGDALSIPSSIPLELVDNDPLDQPVEPEFRTGAMSLGWDPTTAQVVIEAFPIIEVDDDDPFDDVVGADMATGSPSDAVLDALRALDLDDADVEVEAVEADVEIVEAPEILRVRIPVGTARAFAARTLEIVGAGRPICPICGTPIDPEGHEHVVPGHDV